MKKLKLFEDFVLEAANIKDVAKNILDGLDNTAQLHVDYVPKEALSTIESSLKKNKSLSGKDAAKAAKEIRTNLEEIGILSNTFSPIDVEIIIMKHLNEGLNEATTSWSKMMKGVKAGESGPWSLVAIENNKVVGQRINIQIRDILPAEFEAFRKEHPKARIHIEDSTGGVVWNESLINEDAVSTFLVLTQAALVMGQLAILGNKIGADAGFTPVEDLKKWWQKRKSDKAVKTIIDKIKDDKDVVEFMKLTPSQQRGKFRSLIATKLNDEELEYLNRINRNHFQTESIVNEAKTLTRDELMDLLENKYKIKTVRTSEEFNGQTEGIWVAGDNEEELSGNRMFDYYNRSAKYTNGVLKQLRTAVEKTGWWFEWNDPGTIMIWPKN